MPKAKVQFFMDEEKLRVIDEFLDGTMFSRQKFFEVTGNLQAEEICSYYQSLDEDSDRPEFDARKYLTNMWARVAAGERERNQKLHEIRKINKGDE
jgi:hypothetical protein